MEEKFSRPLVISLLTYSIAVCRLAPDAAVPDWAVASGFCSVTRTPEELSVVCQEELVPAGTRMEGGWRVLKVEGPLEFSLTGILAGLAGALARAEISLFAVSTFDTDYILIKAKDQQKALAALRQAGCTVRSI